MATALLSFIALGLVLALGCLAVSYVIGAGIAEDWERD